MCSSKKPNHSVNKLHLRATRTSSNVKERDFETLLENNKQRACSSLKKLTSNNDKALQNIKWLCSTNY